MSLRPSVSEGHVIPADLGRISAEVLIAAVRKDVLAGMQRMLNGLAMAVVPLMEERALAAAAG
jgi:hypothetical protein